MGLTFDLGENGGMEQHKDALFDLPDAAAPSAAGPGAPSDVRFPFGHPARAEELMAPDWAEALQENVPRLHQLANQLATEATAGHRILPAPESILRAFRLPMEAVKVVIIGQDPYPTPGHAVGLSFSVDRSTLPLPRSLGNILKELSADLGVEAPACGDLTPWEREGVLLLNRVLTVRAGKAASHRGLGWEEFTAAALRALADRGGPLVAILWGRDAMALKPLLGAVPAVESAHPSPLSASRGFFGSRPFSRANRLLVLQGARPVQWELTP